MRHKPDISCCDEESRFVSDCEGTSEELSINGTPRDGGSIPPHGESPVSRSMITKECEPWGCLQMGCLRNMCTEVQLSRFRDLPRQWPCQPGSQTLSTAVLSWHTPLPKRAARRTLPVFHSSTTGLFKGLAYKFTRY